MLQREDFIVPQKLKKRPLREISIHEQAKIIHAVTVDFLKQEDVALKYSTSRGLVCRLVRQYRQDPFLMSKKLARQHSKDITAEAVQLEVEQMLRDKVAIENAELVKARVLERKSIDVSVSRVKVLMKQQLGMSYRTAKKVPKQGNTEHCLVLR